MEPPALFCLLFFISNSLFPASALTSDGTALLSLLRHWKYVPSSIDFSWNASHSTPCSWLGVHCNHYAHVVALNLSGFGFFGQLGPEIAYLTHLNSLDVSYNNFSGSIPLSFFTNCTHLQTLDLSHNNFSGQIPPTLGDLQSLEFLSLWANSLTGTIPESLFRIPLLTTLYLNDNRLTGSIPSVIGNSTRLLSLYLYNNQLTGTIPSSIGNCTSLREIYLSNNYLSGELPDALNQLHHLQYLYLNDNNLVGWLINLQGLVNCKELVLSDNQFSGGIPPGLGNCTLLTKLSAVNCGIHGTIPASLGQLTHLTLVYLSENHLSGAIPPELGNCKAMMDLQLYQNQLEGHIPSELGMLTHLHTLMLFNNHLSGEIPISIWKIPSLEYLYVYQNALLGEIPQDITELKQLKNISLFENHLSGVIPQGLGVNSSLILLDLTRNNFTGPIPPGLCFSKKLSKLLLGYNRFEGSIPQDVGSCFSLARLILKQNNLSGMLPEFVQNSQLLFMDLSSNAITGPLPSSLGNLSTITYVDLSFNNFTGHLPPDIGKLAHLEALNLSSNSLEGVLVELMRCHKLSKLDVSRNMLNGSIPSTIKMLTQLSILDLSHNRFGGSIPTSLFQLGKLSFLELSANQLGATIPPSIGLEVEAQSLRLLNLSNNRLTGGIPAGVGNLKVLEQLDVCCNQLSGNLEAIGELHSLIGVNVSYNFFSGPVPPLLMDFASHFPWSFIGNPDLCINCHPKDGERRKNGGLRQVHIALIALGSFLFIANLGLGSYCVSVRRQGSSGHDFVGCIEEGSASLLNKVMEATENLHDKYVIGRGGNGTVYKVALGMSEVYALKKLDCLGIKGGNTSLIREIQTIGKVRHRNLVKLEDFWLRKDYGLILYSYMPNGSLADVLHGMRRPLQWNSRHKIALGTAHGLSYLHYDCNPAIIHRDIKPMNILLDSDLEPHISDFGIAKLLKESAVLTHSSKVYGTIGYMAPEKAFSTRSSIDGDVYAYGVVLLELITRKKVFDPSFGGVDIVGWLRSMWSETGEIDVVLDPDLVDECIDSSIRMQVKDVLLLALQCTENDPTRRPTMRDVVKQLSVESGSKIKVAEI